MSFEIIGKLIQKYDTQQINERFRKREFVLEMEENANGNVYTNYAKMQLVQAKCDLLDRFNDGDMMKVNFNIRGNRWERDGEVRYITSLDAWRLEPASADAQTGGGSADPYAQGYNASQGGGGNYNQGGYNQGGGGYNQGGNRGGGNQGGYGNQQQGGGSYGQPAGGTAGGGADAGADDLPF